MTSQQLGAASNIDTHTSLFIHTNKHNAYGDARTPRSVAVSFSTYPRCGANHRDAAKKEKCRARAASPGRDSPLPESRALPPLLFLFLESLLQLQLYAGSRTYSLARTHIGTHARTGHSTRDAVSSAQCFASDAGTLP